MLVNLSGLISLIKEPKNLHMWEVEFDKNTNKIKSITLPNSKYIVKEVSK